MNQGIRNANDAISMIQTADGALQVIDEKLIRMKELAEQAATGTYTSDQRIIIDSEYQAMANEITRIANATDFNGVYLLNGNLSGSAHNGSGLTSTGKLKVHFGTSNDSSEDYYFIQISNCTAEALGLKEGTNGGVSRETMIQANIDSQSLTDAGYDLTLQNVLDNWSGIPSYWATDFDTNQSSDTYSSPVGSVKTWFFTNNDGSLWQLIGYDSGSFAGDSLIGTPTKSSTGKSISTQQGAQEALLTIRDAIISKDKIRANLGALQNRLENTISNLQIQAENLQTAESQISDTDVAQEMTSFVKEQILSQAAVAMLAQANSLPKMALQIITG
jgi:flagellin